MVVGGALAKKTVRATKSVTKGYSNAQSKVRSATKNDPSAPTSRELSEISALTYTKFVCPRLRSHSLTPADPIRFIVSTSLR